MEDPVFCYNGICNRRFLLEMNSMVSRRTEQFCFHLTIHVVHSLVELNLRIVVCRIDKQKLQMTSLKFWVKFPRRCRYMTELNYVLTWEWGHKRQTDPHNFIGIRIFAEKKGENFRYWHEFNLFYLLLAKCDFQPSYGASFACGLTVRETILLWCSRGRRAYALEVSFRNSLWRLIYIISSWNQIL